ncbi:MAG: hypothetical protein ABSG43_01880 [Solirubrobacteraceae bacterium]|jgi:hypothetical protein
MKRIHAVTLLIVGFALTGCGSTAETVSVERTMTVVQQRVASSPSDTTTVIEPAPQTTTVTPAPPAGSLAAPANPVPIAAGFRACDQNISASADASCALAENVFYELWQQSDGNALANSTEGVSAYSPVSRATFTFECGADSYSVTCTSDSDSADVVTFQISAIAEYTQADANEYLSTHDVG